MRILGFIALLFGVCFEGWVFSPPERVDDGNGEINTVSRVPFTLTPDGFCGVVWENGREEMGDVFLR